MQPAWIWLKHKRKQLDVYAEFYDTFTVHGGSPVSMQISCDSNYAVYVNGQLADSGQYPDFPHFKVFDVLQLSSLCRDGGNHLAIIVWHYGEANMSYFPGTAGLYYTVQQNDAMLACSRAQVLSRQSRAYLSGIGKRITGQLGFSFHYDARREDGWMNGTLNGFRESKVVCLPPPTHARPIEKCVISAPINAECIFSGSTHALFDLGMQQVGYLTLSVRSEKAQRLTVSYGEHIVDGDVRRLIDGRDFSVQITVPAGETHYMNPFRRLGARYLSLQSQHPIEIQQLTLSPVAYPVQYAESPMLDALQSRIYDASIHTLLMCMHDHYEDSPWREQALYAMDSRNQMLCGYYAFREFRFARASLQLMAQDRRADGLLSICTPSGNDLTIPSFSLHYFTEVLEYTRYSGDLTLAHEVFLKLESVMDAFIRHMKGDALPIFTDSCHWNFYEWSDGLSGSLGSAEADRYDAALNCLFSLALHCMACLCRLTNHPSEQYDSLQIRVNAAINKLFLDESTRCYRNSNIDGRISQLVNALAILCGAADLSTSITLAQKLISSDSGMTGITLSMRCFMYDALLKTDRQQYQTFILEDIAIRYRRMLDAGATTFWETELGEKDFHNAGSLCHGWSAMPVYYYHLFFEDEHPLPYYQA